MFNGMPLLFFCITIKDCLHFKSSFGTNVWTFGHPSLAPPQDILGWSVYSVLITISCYVVFWRSAPPPMICHFSPAWIQVFMLLGVMLDARHRHHIQTMSLPTSPHWVNHYIVSLGEQGNNVLQTLWTVLISRLLLFFLLARLWQRALVTHYSPMNI